MANKQVLFICLLIALIASCLGSWDIHTYSIPCDTMELRVNYTLPSNPTFFTLFYCFEEFDAYSTVNNIATTDSVDQLWDPNSLYSTVVYNVTGYANFLFKARNNNSTYNGTCATFNHVVYTAESDFDTFYVQPKDRTETAKLASGGTSGSVYWKKTDNPTDTYEVYWAETQEAPQGQNWATACSVRQWMNPFTDEQGEIDTDDEETGEVKVKNLDPKTPFTVVVVVNRGGNSIAGVYDRIALNGKSAASALLPSMMVIVMVAVAMLW
jgi:hypothetical protein